MTRELVFYSSDTLKKSVKDFVSRGIWGLGTSNTFEDNCVPIALMESGKKMVAGIIFHNFNKDAQTIEISCYSSVKNWLTRDVLNKILRYPFNEIGVRIVTARFSEDNYFIARIVKRLNSKVYILPELWGVKKDQLFAILKADDWKKTELFHERT